MSQSLYQNAMAPSRSIDLYFTKKPAPAAPAKPNKRTRDSAAIEESAKTKKAKVAPKPKLKKSTKPEWTAAHLSLTPPTGANAQKCVGKWSLLAPYDIRITEDQWDEYYKERIALEKTNTLGTEEYKRISSEELMQNTARLLGDARDILAQVILGSCLENTQSVEIAKILKGSLYYLDLWGNEEDGGSEDEDGGRQSFSPRTVSSTTRLYSPFGLGTSVDFKYHYHNRWSRNNEQFSALAACSRTIGECSGAQPFDCAAQMGGRGPIGPPIEGSVRLFYWGGIKTTGTTAANMADLEDSLFACSSWLSPRLMFKLLCAGGTATLYQESATSHVESVQDKFKLYEGEKNGVSTEEE